VTGVAAATRRVAFLTTVLVTEVRVTAARTPAEVVAAADARLVDDGANILFVQGSDDAELRFTREVEACGWRPRRACTSMLVGILGGALSRRASTATSVSGSDDPLRSDYDPTVTELCERALVTILGNAGWWGHHLYLVAGLAPRYLTVPPPASRPAHVGTRDVDLGLALAFPVKTRADYESLAQCLQRAGFGQTRDDPAFT